MDTLPLSDIPTPISSSPSLPVVPPHNHDGVNSLRISYNDLIDLPNTLFTGTVQVLVVGAGGAGGNNAAGGYPGGGGGGGVSYTPAYDVISHVGANQAYSVTVGTGGSFATGGTSTFHNLNAYGGLQGTSGSAGTAGTGGAGGSGTTQNGGAGGNGNAAGAGGNGSSGYTSSISGASVGYAGGGGAFGSTSNGNGTDGGGTNNVGTANTGGGGGCFSGGGSFAGASGVVIVRYVTSAFGPCTGGTITTSGSDTIHTFTSSGTFTVVAR